MSQEVEKKDGDGDGAAAGGFLGRERLGLAKVIVGTLRHLQIFRDTFSAEMYV